MHCPHEGDEVSEQAPARDAIVLSVGRPAVASSHASIDARPTAGVEPHTPLRRGFLSRQFLFGPSLTAMPEGVRFQA
jgi:hypothetical protein